VCLLKKIIFFLQLLLVLSQLSGSRDICLAATNTRATLKRTTDDDRRRLAYATRYYIELELTKPLSLNQIEDAQTFLVFNKKTGEAVPIIRSTFKGIEKPKGYYSHTCLWGDLRPDVTYLVRVSYPDIPLQTVETRSDDAIKDTSESTFFNFVSDRASFTFEPMIVENTDVMGFKYDFEFRAFHWSLSQGTANLLDLNLTSSGEFGTDTENKEVQNSIKGGFSLDYRKHLMITWAVPQPKSKSSIRRQFIYPIGFRLKPVEFESNKNFDLLNYTAKIQFAISVPYSDWPVLWWHSQSGVNRPFFPLLFFTGYTLVQEVKNSASTTTNKTNHRWDSEALYYFSLSNSDDFGIKWYGFMLEGGKYKRLIDLSLMHYLSDSRSTGIECSYQNGSLPPEFKDTKSYRLGFVVKYF
jgi:hypothetical protein